MLRATGRVARITSKPWEMDKGTANHRSGTTVTARLIVGDADFLDVKIPEGQRIPDKGETVDWGVIAQAGERGRLSVSRAMEWAEVVGEDVAPLKVAK